MERKSNLTLDIGTERKATCTTLSLYVSKVKSYKFLVISLESATCKKFRLICERLQAMSHP
jgi:hypothetical protein